MAKSFSRILFLFAATSMMSACGGPAAETTSAAPTANAPAKASTDVATSEPTFVAAAVSPLTRETPLQIVSVFSYEAGETLLSPATELLSFITKPRTDEGFGKEALRTLLLSATQQPSLKAQNLLFIALGPRAEFSIERVRAVGQTAMRETLKMNVDHMAFAPLARDQGVTTLGPDVVAQAFVEGALVEFVTEQGAQPARIFALRDVTYEAGPQFVDAVNKAVARGITAAHAKLNVAHQ